LTGAATASFTYDGDGKQVKSIVGGVTTYYVGQHYEKKGTTVTKYYFAGATRLAVRTNGTLSFLLGDHLGSSSVTTNASGVKTASALYKAWGETRYSSGALGTDYKFTGQREQAELGLYFYGARWFDPSIGRFTSPDTMIPSTQGTQAWDRYAYVNNNPVRYNDPTGHMITGDGPSHFDHTNADTDPCLLYGADDPRCPTSQQQGGGGGSVCSPEHWSILCGNPDPTYVGGGWANSDKVYPQSQAVDNMMADKTGVWITDLILLLHDLFAIPAGGTLSARMNGAYAQVAVLYEVHENQFGAYTVVTDAWLNNRTNSPLTLENIVANTGTYSGIRLEPTSMLQIADNNNAHLFLPNLIATSITFYLSSQIQITLPIPQSPQFQVP